MYRTLVHPHVGQWGPSYATGLFGVTTRTSSDSIARRSRAWWSSTAKNYGSSSTEKAGANNNMILYDSLSGQYKSVCPEKEKGLGWYTCGPTTYAPTHLGHARTYVCLDILRRVLRTNHKSLLWIMNITDVDDKLFNRAKELGTDPVALARHYEREFWHDMEALHVQRPDVVVRVTESVSDIIVPYIEKIINNGMAYVAQDQSVYFDVRAFEDRTQARTRYGKLAPPQNSSDFFSSVKEESTKRDTRDFVLWKPRKEGESVSWDSPWGPGRPGWHIECSAMIESIAKQFQETHEIRVHAGGVDLKFPHHTNEIAQAEAFQFSTTSETTKEWIPHWVHTGHLNIQGRKMSKSLKNFITVREMLESEDDSSSLSSSADDFRLWCLGLSGSYRGPATYSKEQINQAQVLREKLVQFLLEGEQWITESDERVSSSNNMETQFPLHETLVPRKWVDKDYVFYRKVQDSSEKCHQAIMGCISKHDVKGEDNQRGGFDLDGSTYVNEMIQIAETGSAHIRSCPVGSAAVEPVRVAIVQLRQLLSLVGFSEKTTHAGVSLFEHNNMNNESHIKGGERALVEELVKFRSEIRKTALAHVIRQKGDPPLSNSIDIAVDILKLCDNARDSILPSIGLQISDDKVVTDSNEQDVTDYTFCVPRSIYDPPSTTTIPKATPSSVNYKLVQVEDLFRVGQYEGMFSDYDTHGIPVLNMDGTEISNRLLKKLQKKRTKYLQRLTTSKTATKG